MGEIRSKTVWLGQVLAVNDDALGAAQGFPNVLLLPGVSAVPVARAAGAAGAAAAGLLRRLRLLLLAKLLALLLGAPPALPNPALSLFGPGRLSAFLVGVWPTGQQRGAGGWGGWGLEGFPLILSPFFGVFSPFLT